MNLTRASKFLSLVLRHDPAAAGVTLDAAGWVRIEELLHGCTAHGQPLTREQLDEIVRTDDKQRYAISDDGLSIRANQGHSVPVDLGLSKQTPPVFLYHGTADRFADDILRDGLKPMGRQHVHLSKDEATAITVGRRHGRPIVFRVAAGAMAKSGHTFYLSANDVWLTDAVPPQFLSPA